MAVGLLLAGCTSSNHIAASWKNPDMPVVYKQMRVAVLTPGENLRQTLEGELLFQLEKQGVQAAGSTEEDILETAGGALENREALLRQLLNDGHKALLLVSILDETTDSRFVPGNLTYDPTLRFSFYGNFLDYYTHYYPTVYDPGYYTEDSIYFLDINLYDTETGSLVWSAQTEAYQLKDMEAFAEEFSRMTIEAMKSSELID